MMRRAEIVKPREKLQVAEHPIPEAPPNGVVVKVSRAGVCHTDIHVWEDHLDLGNGKVLRFSDKPGYKFPAVPGHEISGIVYSLGSKTDGTLKVGDKVIVYPWLGCGNCGMCRAGDPHQCDDTLHGLGVGVPGGFSTHVVVRDQEYVIPIPESIDSSVATMLPCSALTAYNAVSTLKPTMERMAKNKGTANALFIGAGGLGQWAICLAKAIYPPNVRIFCADITDQRLDGALKAGADQKILWELTADDDTLVARTQQAMDGGIDGSIDFVNSCVTAMRVYRCLNRGGTMICVGLFGGSLAIPLPHLVQKSQTVRGVRVGSTQQLKELVKIVAQNKVTPPPSVEFKLEDANEALTQLNEGKVNGRAILTMD